MLRVTKDEAEEIRKRLPFVDVYVARRQKRGKHYYTEERDCVYNCLDNFRSNMNVTHIQKSK